MNDIRLDSIWQELDPSDALPQYAYGKWILLTIEAPLFQKFEEVRVWKVVDAIKDEIVAAFSTLEEAKAYVETKEREEAT
jgi:hypothetical protein